MGVVVLLLGKISTRYGLSRDIKVVTNESWIRCHLVRKLPAMNLKIWLTLRIESILELVL